MNGTLCASCKKAMKHITFVGFSTVAWTGAYTCGPYDDPQPLRTECERYVPKRSGQTSLEAFL